MTRAVTLVLVDHDGTLLGALPPFQVNTPWWQETTDVVAGARAHHGVDVTVLRLLTADQPAPPGGHVTYLAALDGGDVPRFVPAEVDLTPDRRRALWAEPAGPQLSVHWAVQALAESGRSARAVTQMRTWNLSAIWRIDTKDGAAWLKQVPGFFAHESDVLHWVAAAAPGTVPVPIAASDGRMLLDDIPGEDAYDAGPADRLVMLADLHTIQLAAADRVEELLAVRVPDRRAPALGALIRDVVARHGGPEMDHVIDDLDDRLAALAACGVPDTLVHGDFHPGNVRGATDGWTIIDWGDSMIGHPAIDLLRMCEGASNVDQLRAEWCGWWRAAVPGCDPEAAIALVEPIVALRNAAVYAGFLDAIEPTEWPYHAADVPYWLEQAVAANSRRDA